MKLSEDSILKLLHTRTSRPLKVSEMVKQLRIPDPQRRAFRNLIKQMAAEGKLVRLRGGRYGLPDEMNLVTGILQGNPNGFGFVVPEYPEEGDDIYVSRKKMGEAMHRDRVMVRVEKSRGSFGRPEGRVIRILQRNTADLVGTFETLGREGWVVPLEQKYFHDIFIPAPNVRGAKNGQVVHVAIEHYPTPHKPPVGQVTEVLGHAQDPEVELKSVFRKYGVHEEFPPEVLDEAERIAAHPPADEKGKRKDLRDRMIFTIDGEKAKDFDDAVSIEKMNPGYRLGVHIADVSYFVPEGSALDEEAFERGTSIYYPDGVIPMLPFPLSNNICSLKPREDRLTMSVFIDYDKQGNVTGSQVFNSIIRSQHRFTYTQVARLLEKRDPDPGFEDAMESLVAMQELSRRLRRNRFKSGSVNFNVPEPEILFDDEGRIQNIVIAEHNIAHELIEEFMLAANQAVARYLWDKKVPSIHRIHETPDEDRIAQFNEFIQSFGMRLKRTHHVRSTDLQHLLERVKGHPEERTINTLLLRTMKKAQYSESDPGHFCLGFKHYTHFTSPIRRYPDLVIHRLLKGYLKRRQCSVREQKQLRPRVQQAAEQSTQMEEKATAIEREVDDLRRAQFMADKVGKVYTGLIISVTAFGFFVELKEVFVEGLVRLSSLQDDYYIYIEPEHKLMGQRKHRVFRIGDDVKVRVKNVDIANRQIEFSLVKKL